MALRKRVAILAEELLASSWCCLAPSKNIRRPDSVPDRVVDPDDAE
ncbi:MAG: hypothetical protein ACRD5H_00110 [Nitrososphaerales archaeon]